MLIAIRKDHDERIAQAKANRKPVPRPFSAATAHRLRATLRSALNSALRAGEVSRNVAALADMPTAKRPKVKVWEPEQLGEFLDGIAADGERLYPLLHLAAFAGLRRGELCGLRWQDVNLDACTVDVAWERTTAGHQVVESRPKTDGSESMIDIDERTADVTKEDGCGLHPDFVSYRFEKLVARHGMPRITLHKLRHLAASLQIAAGIDIGIVSKRLRHSSIKITNDTYSHMIGSIGRQAAKAAAAMVPMKHKAS